jgi:hypothetical protein
VPSDHTTVSSEILASKRSGASLNLLTFNATFISGKGKKSYGTEFGEYRGCSYPELYMQTNPFNFTFHPVFTMYFLAGAIRCQCSNAGLQFVFVE